MSKIIIDAEGFKDEISSLRTNKDAVPQNPYTQEKNDLDLESIQEFLDVTKKLNETLDQFKELTEKDARNLEIVLAEWMNVDSSLAGMSLWDQIIE